MRKMGLKTDLFNILMLIYIELTKKANSKTYVIPMSYLCNTHLNPKNLSYIPLNIENNMISLLFLDKTLFWRF